jgi:hypothetical protein
LTLSIPRGVARHRDAFALASPSRGDHRRNARPKTSSAQASRPSPGFSTDPAKRMGLAIGGTTARSTRTSRLAGSQNDPPDVPAAGVHHRPYVDGVLAQHERLAGAFTAHFRLEANVAAVGSPVSSLYPIFPLRFYTNPLMMAFVENAVSATATGYSASPSRSNAFCCTRRRPCHHGERPTQHHRETAQMLAANGGRPGDHRTEPRHIPRQRLFLITYSFPCASSLPPRGEGLVRVEFTPKNGGPV